MTEMTTTYRDAIATREELYVIAEGVADERDRFTARAAALRVMLEAAEQQEAELAASCYQARCEYLAACAAVAALEA